MTAPAALDVATIARRLNARAADLAPWLLPNGRRSACRRYWETNSLADSPSAGGGRSLKVELGGRHQGLWRDHANGEHGDMIDLATHRRFGGDKGAAVQWAKSELGLDTLDPARVAQVAFQERERAEADDEAARREAEAKVRGARSLWLSGVGIADTPAARYLEGRGIDPARLPDGKWPGSLRFHEEVWNADAGAKLPAMLATMVAPGGAQMATHRTWLGRERTGRLCRERWVKADAADLGVPRGNAKKVIGKSGGAFVPIAKGASGVSLGQLRAAETVYVTEGIEDALCVAMVRPAFRVIAAYSLGNLGAIVFPRLIERVVLVADRDGKAQAVDALERAIARQQARGVHVQLVMPPVGVKDVNDWLLSGDVGVAA